MAILMGTAINICASQSRQHSIVYLFSHGALDTYRQAYKYLPCQEVDGQFYDNRHAIIDLPLVTFNYPDAVESRWGFKGLKWWLSSFGQENEIDLLASTYHDTAKSLEDGQGIVLVGLSRGASVSLSFIARDKPEHVKAVVLESPFDCLDSVIEGVKSHIPELAQRIPGLAYIVGLLFKSSLVHYKPEQKQAFDYADAVPHTIPVLIVCSKEDRLVPAHSSIRLYEKLRATGHPHTYLLVLDKGKHAALLQGQEGAKYERVVHAFYQAHNINHDPCKAALGIEELLTCKKE